MATSSKTTPRTRYHHGDLRNALTESAVELARTGGPEAVVLREVARRVGVSATAAYRHFTTVEDLLDQVKRAALDELAVAITTALAAVPEDGDPGDAAVARLRASGDAYIEFAISQPGLFLTAFCRMADHNAVPLPVEDLPFEDAEAYKLLGMLLDEVLALGRMDPERRPGAEIASWSAVHGFAVLSVDGPFSHHLSAEQQRWARDRTMDMVINGLTRGASPAQE